VSCTQRTPAGLPPGIPGIGEEIEGATQHAPQPTLHSIPFTPPRLYGPVHFKTWPVALPYLDSTRGPGIESPLLYGPVNASPIQPPSVPVRQTVAPSRPLRIRALLIYAALACLCVSDGVGPRLLPYPSHAVAPTASPTEAARHSAAEDSPAERRAFAGEDGGAHRLSKAGDTFKKLPVFGTAEADLWKSSPARQAAGNLSPPDKISAPSSTRFGRGPPPNSQSS